MHRVTAHASFADGVEEVFAAVGESVSLSCRRNSSVIKERKVKWTENNHRLTDDVVSQNAQTKALRVTEVSALHAGEYQCLDFSRPERVINNIWLYTLDGELRKKHENIGKIVHTLDLS